MEGGKLGRAGVGNASDGCCGRGGALPAAWLHLPRPGGDDPSEARASRPFLPISPAGTARPAPPIGCRFRDASDSANQRGEARFGNFFLLGPGAVQSSRGGARREGPQEARATGPEGGRGEGLLEARCSPCHALWNTRTPLLHTGCFYLLLRLPKNRQRNNWSEKPGH